MGTLIVFGVFILIAFTLGIYFGQMLRENKPIEINPVKTIKENRIIRKEQKEKEKVEKIEEINLANIDSYNGTGEGQIEFPS